MFKDDTLQFWALLKDAQSARSGLVDANIFVMVQFDVE